MNTFPQPLPYEEERKLLQKYKEGDQWAKDRLIEHNLRLVAHIVKKYQNNEEDMQDLISVGTIGLIKAVSTFDFERGKLCTYAARCIENELLMYFRGRKKLAKEVSLYEPIGNDKEGNVIHLIDVLECEELDLIGKMELQEHTSRLKQLLMKCLTPREQEVIIMRYGLGKEPEITQREVGIRLGISRSYVSRIEKKALYKLQRAFCDI